MGGVGNHKGFAVEYGEMVSKIEGYVRKLESTIALVLTLLCANSAAVATEYYTWVDENGVVNFSERDPENYSAELINTRTARTRAFGFQRPTASTEADSSNLANSTTDESELGEDGAGLDPEIDAQIADEKARMQAEIAQTKRSNCAIGRRNLAQLETYARVRVLDDDGTERTLTDEQKRSRIEEARKTIRENCTG